MSVTDSDPHGPCWIAIHPSELDIRQQDAPWRPLPRTRPLTSIQFHREPNMRKRKLKRIEVKRDSWRTAAELFEATQSILQLALRNYRANLWVRQTLACAPPRPAGFAARVDAVRIVDFTVGARPAGRSSDC